MGLNLYLRKNRVHKGTIDLATLTNDNPGHGALKAFIGQFEDLVKSYGHKRIYVENVLNPRLEKFLRAHKYIKLSGLSADMDLPCYEKTL
jgi:hypothetical protein